MKPSTPSESDRLHKIGALTLTALALWPALMIQAADISWTGGTASYTNAANWGGIVPGPGDTAINDNGTNNVVQINSGNPDWTLGRLRAGNGTGSGAFEQNGQTVTVNVALRPFRMGVAPGFTGVYTLNGGALVFTNGDFVVGQLGTGILNVNGGTISGSANFAVNIGTSIDAVNATMDGGTNRTGFTWFEQGLYATDPTRGLPPASTTFPSVSDATHSYTMPSSYAGNSSVMLNVGVPIAEARCCGAESLPTISDARPIRDADARIPSFPAALATQPRGSCETMSSPISTGLAVMIQTSSPTSRCSWSSSCVPGKMRSESTSSQISSPIAVISATEWPATMDSARDRTSSICRRLSPNAR